MRTLFIIGLLSVSLSQVAWAQEKRYTLELSQPQNPAQLHVEMRFGSVNIEGYDGNKVEVIARFRPLSEHQLAQLHDRRERHHQAQQQPEKPSRPTDGLTLVNNSMMNLEISEQDNHVDIESEESTYHVDLTVRVPQKSTVKAELYEGEKLSVSNVSGAIELETWRGDIVASGISGPIVAETHQNPIVVIFNQFNGENPTSLTTYSGDIDISLPTDIKAQVNVQNYQGKILSGIASEFKATEGIERNDKRNKQQIVIGGQMSAKVNGGGQNISLITYSGDVYVREK